MSAPVLWPRLARRSALPALDALRGMTLPEARLTGRLSHPDATPAAWAPRVGDEQIATLQAALRAVADERGWPNALAPRAAGELDRAWARCLARMELVPVDGTAAGVWTFVAVVVVPDLARWRFPAGPVERFVEFDDHVFGRLWWRHQILGAELLEGAGSAPLTEDELVALFRRRDVVANPAVARAIARRVLTSEVPAERRLAAMKGLVLEVLRTTPSVSLDVLDDQELDELTDELLRRSEARR